MPSREEKSLYYHGLKEQKRLDVSKLKYFSVLLAVIGVAVLLVAAQGAQAPLMHVKEVTGNYMMNYAVIRVSGMVVNVPHVSITGGKLSIIFTVDDGTGALDIRVYSPVADRMLEEGLVPFPGDNITAEVQLRVRETYTYAMLQYLGGLKFNERLYSENPPTVKELDPNMSYSYVAVQGIVTALSNVSSGYLLTVDTGKAPVTVLVPRVLLMKGNLSLKVGDMVYAPGIVYLYKGTSPEIVVRSLEQFSVTPIENAPVVPLSEASKYPGMVMAVQGNLSGISYENGRYVVTLSNGTDYLEVLVPREVLASLNPFEVSAGSLIKAAGRMGEDGRLLGAYLGVVKPVKTEFLPIGVLSPEMRGSIVAVEANIESTQKVGSNLKLTVSDGTGRIDVFIPSATLRELSNETLAGLKKGLGVKIAGYLDEYRGRSEIVVYTADGIEALGRPINPSEIQLPKVSASELGKYVGRLVDFEGSLQGLSYVNGTYYLRVDGVSVSLPRKVLLNLNPLEAGNGSLVSVRAIVMTPTSLRGENLTVETPLPPIQIRPDQVTPDMVGQLVAVVGRVTGVANISGNLKITLGELTVFIPGSTAYELSYVPSKGDLVEVGGYVELYRGEPEVVVFHPDAIAKLEEKVTKGSVAEFQKAVSPMLLTVTWDSITYKDGKYSLKVHDETGSVSLIADRSLLPNPLEVATGSTLEVVADPLSGSITSLKVVKAVPPKLLKTGQVTLELRGRIVAVNGTAVSVGRIGNNLKLVLDDGSGSVNVFVPGGADVTVKEGTVVEVAGYVDEYGGKPEIIVYNTSAIRTFKAKPSTREITVSELSSLTSGKANLTVIWDTVTYDNGYKITVHDDTGSTTLSISRELLPNPFNAGTGSKVKVTYDADSRKIVALRVLEAKPSPKLATGDVTLSYQGKTVIVEGTIVDVYEGKSFIKLTIDDGSGELVVFIPKSVAGDISFSEGQTITVGGYVTEYKGTVEVVPYTPDAIEVR